MSEIQRYRFGRTEVTKSDTGEWVDYDDAKMLLDKIAALEAEVRAWRDADARHDLTRTVMGEDHNDEVLKAMRATDKSGALQ